MTMDMHQILEDYFGYTSFRNQQEQIIQAVLSGKDALVIMPTGGGKSLCYQIPALLKDGLTIVVSPLIALMNDQVAALQNLDISAEALHSGKTEDEIRHIHASIQSGTLKLLYVSPEKLLSPGFLSYLKEQKVSLFAIDEAHCVSVWGNDFRPDYVQLSQLKQTFPSVNVIALTATADATTRDDIEQQLGLLIEKPFISSFERKNITIRTAAGTKRLEQIVRFVRERPKQAGIIYCLSRKSTEKVAQKLSSMGILAAAYHAGMPALQRRNIQTQFQDNDIHIVCATIAFGMGIDKPNIRFVIHYNMPKNIEGYYQEIGRAGRDGHPAEALLFSSWGDMLNLRKFIENSDAEPTFKKIQEEKLERMWQFASDHHCRTNFILNYFGEYREEGCQHCDNCLDPPEYFDGTTYSQMALSAAVRTKESATLQVIIDILKGTYSPEVKMKDYQHLKTFGVGRTLTFNEWKDYLTQIINKGLLKIDYSQGSQLKLTPLSMPILKGDSKIDLAAFVPHSKKAKKPVPKLMVDNADMNEALFEQLKSWRTQQAKANKVPAYVILHDKALRQIAHLEPKTKEELLMVDGIGEKKLEKYGEDIMGMVEGEGSPSVEVPPPV